MPLEPIQFGGDLIAEAQHRLLGIAVLALEACQRVEAVVDRLEPPRFHRTAIAERPERDERVVDLRFRCLQDLTCGLERGVEACQVPDDAPRLREAANSRRLLFRQERGHFSEAAREPLGVLKTLPLRAKGLFFAWPQPGGIELRDLEAQQIFPLGAVTLGDARPLHIPQRGAMLCEQRGDDLPERFRFREPVEEVELPPGLEQPVVLMLPVHLDEMIAEALQEGDRDGRIVDERPMTARACELAADQELFLIGQDARAFKDGRGR